MKITGFNGVTFASLNVTASSGMPNQPSAPREPIQIARTAGDAEVLGVITSARIVSIIFTPIAGQPNEDTLEGVLAKLQIRNHGNLHLLQGQLADGVTNVEALAKVATWQMIDATRLRVDFILAGLGWKATAYTDLAGGATNISADTTLVNSSDSDDDIDPIILVYWPTPPGTNRSGGTSTAGWRREFAYTITNIGEETIRNQPYQIGPIDTATLVTGALMMANGNDLRVFVEGKELRRNLIGMNTKFTLIWVILPEIQPQQTITIEVWADNASAGSPPTLTLTSDPCLPALDISGYSAKPSSSTTTVITFAGTPFEVDELVGATVVVASATAGRDKQFRRCQNNSTNTVTVTPAFHAAPTSADDIIITNSGLHGEGGSISGATSTVLTVDNYGQETEMVGAQIEIITGTGSGQVRTISAAGPTITVSSAFSPVPDATSRYRMWRRNGKRKWDMRTFSGAKATKQHKGLWFANRSQSPPTDVHFEAAGSWHRFTYLRNEDEYSQPRYHSELIGAGNYDHHTVVNLQRARKGKGGTQRERGVADAVGHHSPFPIISWLASTVHFRNAKKAGSGSPGQGMCTLLWLCQETGGELWTEIKADNAVYSTLTSTSLFIGTETNLTGYGSPNRIAMALVPNGGDEIPENDNNTAQAVHQANSASLWMLAVNPAAVITESNDAMITAPTFTAGYEVYLQFNTGGASPTNPHYRLTIGGPDRRIMIAVNTERIRIDCEKRQATLVDASGAFIRRINYAVLAIERITDPDGVTRDLSDARWLPWEKAGGGGTNIRIVDPAGNWGTLNRQITGKYGYLL